MSRLEHAIWDGAVLRVPYLICLPLLRQITCGGFGLVVSTHGLFSSVFLLGFMGQIYVSVVTQDRQF